MAAAAALFACNSVADPLDHWTRLSISGAPNLRAVAYGNGHYVATGDGGAISASIDGFSSNACQSGSSGQLPSVTYGNGAFVTAAWNAVLTSTDATNCTSTASAPIAQLRDIIFAKGMFVGAQTDGYLGGGIANSQDGIHWSAQSTPYFNHG